MFIQGIRVPKTFYTFAAGGNLPLIFPDIIVTDANDCVNTIERSDVFPRTFRHPVPEIFADFFLFPGILGQYLESQG